MSTDLTLLSEASRMLAEARTFEDVRKIRDVAEAARAYAKAHNLGVDAQNKAAAVVVEADIRGGELLRQMVKNGERRYGGDENSQTVFSLPTLADLNITPKQSSNAQAIANEAEAVREWMAKAKVLTPARAARVARDASAKRRREEAAMPVLPSSCDLRLGDFREVLADVPDASIDVILTDPPYPAEFLPLWSDLAAFAKRTLKPAGMLVAMSGQTHLPDVMRLIGEHLPYRWTVAFLMPGAANVVHARRVHTSWKPVLVYGGTERRLYDLVRSDSADKEHHAWGQSESGFAELLRLVADPGSVICDPFVGGGTVPVVAMAAECSFVGAEIDPESYQVATERIAA